MAKNGFVSAMDNLPWIVKLILCIPALNIVWAIYRIVKGVTQNKGLILSGLKLVVGEIGVGGVTMKDILVHDAHEQNPGIHMMLVNMKYPDYPVALGVIRDVEDHTYDDEVRDQVLNVQAHTNIRNMDDLLNSGDTWEIE